MIYSTKLKSIEDKKPLIIRPPKAITKLQSQNLVKKPKIWMIQ